MPSPSLLGFEIDGSQDAIQLREAAYKQAGNDPRVIPAFSDADIPVLLGLGILYRRRDGSIARHPLLPTTNEEIVQFFRWAIGDDKHPLPPLVRRILCVKRDILQESVESLHTSPLQRTGERNLLGDIEVLLKNDGVKDLDAACSGREPLASMGAWAAPPLLVNLGALKGPTCDYSSLQAQLERVAEALGDLKPSDSIQQEVLDMLDQLLSILGSLKSTISPADPSGKTTLDMLTALESTVVSSKAAMESANSRNVKRRLEEMLGALGPQLTALGQLSRASSVDAVTPQKNIREEISELQTQLKELKGGLATGTEKNARLAELQTQLTDVQERATKSTFGGGHRHASRRSTHRRMAGKKTRVTRRRSRSHKHRHP